MKSNSSTGEASFGDERAFNGVKIFSATMMNEREHLGETVTAWLREHSQFELRDIIVTQSSDEAFHCIAITVFYWERDPR